MRLTKDQIRSRRDVVTMTTTKLLKLRRGAKDFMLTVNDAFIRLLGEDERNRYGQVQEALDEKFYWVGLKPPPAPVAMAVPVVVEPPPPPPVLTYAAGGGIPAKDEPEPPAVFAYYAVDTYPKILPTDTVTVTSTSVTTVDAVGGGVTDSGVPVTIRTGKPVVRPPPKRKRGK